MSEDKYSPCSCGSGKKFKFCCYEKRENWKSVSERELIRRAAELPVERCLISQTWRERGLAQIVVLREVSDGTLLLGSYLVDVFCLGVKNSFAVRLERHEIRPFLDRSPDAMQAIPYEDARSVVLGAIEFARQFGFQPDQSWAASSPIVEAGRPFEPKFEFGKDGQPLYVQGPDDDVRKIMNRLEPLVKEGRAHYVTVADESDETEFEDEFEEWCDEISCLLEDKSFKEAKCEIEDMLEAYPERWEPIYFKGTCLAMEGKAEQAIPFFNRVIAVHPSPEVYLNLASAHQSLFHLVEWIDSLRKVVELDGQAGDLGKLANRSLNDFAASVEKSDGISLDRFLEGNRIFDRAFEDLNSGRFEEAISGFLQVHKVLPRHVQSYGNLGLAYAGLGDRGRAIECLDKAIELDPNYQPAIENRRVLLKSHDVRLAVQEIREIDFYGDRARASSRMRPKRFRGNAASG